MLLVKDSDVEAALRDWARDWCELLATGQLATACERLDEPNCYGIIWTPEAIGALVSDIFSPDTIFAYEHPEGPRFTSPTTAAGVEQWDWGEFEDGTGYWLHYDVPLNGEFSEITAQFDFFWRSPSTLAVRLHDLHVM